MEDAAVSPDMNVFFWAPAARGMTKLDKSLFSRVLPAAVASVSDNTLISKYRKLLIASDELLRLPRFRTIIPDPHEPNTDRRALVLRPGFDHSSPETWSNVLQEAVQFGEIDLRPHQLQVEYEHWSYYDVMRSVVPPELIDGIPVGFNTAGHIAHLNLREPYQPYKYVIAQAIVDKNSPISTVINKVDNVGDESEFRTFKYEVLAGPDDMTVELTESDCVFRFDYSKTYWNSKLSTEHERLVTLFKPGEVVADVMAGIGPFAVPAGKKNTFVWANDKNPDSFQYLQDAVKRNKVQQFVQPFNQDGHDFIRFAADDVYNASKLGQTASLPAPKLPRASKKARPQPVRMKVPATISHFVMNLPASALEFLHNFKGIYHGKEELFAPHTGTQLPIVHAHCFAIKNNDELAFQEIRDRIEKDIGLRLSQGSMEKEGELEIVEVREIAPSKNMYCASFRLPAQIAFASRQ